MKSALLGGLAIHAAVAALHAQQTKGEIAPMQPPDAYASDDTIVDFKTADQTRRRTGSMLGETLAMVAGVDPQKLKPKHVPKQRQTGINRQRAKNGKAKRKQAAKSRAKNRR